MYERKGSTHLRHLRYRLINELLFELEEEVCDDSCEKRDTEVILPVRRNFEVCWNLIKEVSRLFLWEFHRSSFCRSLPVLVVVVNVCIVACGVKDESVVDWRGNWRRRSIGRVLGSTGSTNSPFRLRQMIRRITSGFHECERWSGEGEIGVI